MGSKMELLKSTWTQVTMAISTVCAFMGSYFMNLTADNTEQYLALSCSCSIRWILWSYCWN
jgi:hypothetical protein